MQDIYEALSDIYNTTPDKEISLYTYDGGCYTSHDEAANNGALYIIADNVMSYTQAYSMLVACSNLATALGHAETMVIYSPELEATRNGGHR
jgi:hypothetical protein